MNSRLSWQLALLLTLPPMLWAGNAVVGRLMVGSVPPLALNAMRWWLALALLLPLGWRVLAQRAAIRRHWRHLALLGLVGVGTYNAMQYLAVQTSTPLNVTLIASSAPAWMLLVGALFYAELPTRRQCAGAALSLLGVLLVLSRGSPAALLQIRLVSGDVYMLVGTALWAVYSWMLARPPVGLRGARRPPWTWAEWLLLQIVFGGAWASALAGGEALAGAGPVHWSGGVIAALLYVALGPSLLAYRCWGLGVSTVGPAMASFFANLTPVFTALLSVVLLGDMPHWYHAASFGLIASGIVVSRARAAARA